MYPSERYQSVMFVDDEEGVRTSWNRLLSERGFDVTTVETGEGAINRLRERAVDVVVSDLRMPGLDGLQLLEWIHDARPQTRFILLTGYGNADVERRARELGAFEYLNKPISPEKLSAVIDAASEAVPADAPSPAPVELRAVEAAIEEHPPASPHTATEKDGRPRNVVERILTLADGRPRSVWQTMLGLAVAPILGLAFVIFLPVLGFGAFLWVAGKAIWQKRAAPARA